MNKCKICMIEKHIDQFYNINKHSYSTCKECIKSKKSLKYLNSNIRCHRKNDRLLKEKNELIECAYSFFGDLYIYEGIEYKGSLDKVIIHCKNHGDFLIRPRDLKCGHGCSKCGNLRKGYNKDRFLNNNNSYFYILLCKNSNESFVKIGITKNQIKNRYKSNKSMPYNFSEYLIIEGSPSKIFDLEKNLKEILKEFQYLPLISFCGSKTECFNSDSLKILSKMKHSLYSEYNIQIKTN